MRGPINYGRQSIDQDDINAVTNALTSDYLTQGPAISVFENDFKNIVGSKFAVACSNGTAALHLAAMSINTKPGDVFLSSPITFAATTNAIYYCGGEIEFVDIDPNTFLMDLNLLEDKLKSNPGKYKGVLPIDFTGAPLDQKRLKKIATKHNVTIIEDACHAPGAAYQKEKIGSGNNSDLTVYSFHPVKHIACGEGGMVTTNNEALYNKMLALRTHGIEKPEGHTDPWYYEMNSLGYNYRITDIQAALGSSQLKKLESSLKRRNEIAKYYRDSLKDLPITLPTEVKDGLHAYHLYVIQTKKRKELYSYLRAKNIFTQVHYIPVYWHPFYQKKGFQKGLCPKAEAYYENCLSIPMYPTLKDDELEYVVESIRGFFK